MKAWKSIVQSLAWLPHRLLDPISRLLHKHLGFSSLPAPPTVVDKALLDDDKLHVNLFSKGIIFLFISLCFIFAGQVVLVWTEGTSVRKLSPPAVASTRGWFGVAKAAPVAPPTNGTTGITYQASSSNTTTTPGVLLSAKVSSDAAAVPDGPSLDGAGNFEGGILWNALIRSGPVFVNTVFLGAVASFMASFFWIALWVRNDTSRMNALKEIIEPDLLRQLATTCQDLDREVFRDLFVEITLRLKQDGEYKYVEIAIATTYKTNLTQRQFKVVFQPSGDQKDDAKNQVVYTLSETDFPEEFRKKLEAKREDYYKCHTLRQGLETKPLVSNRAGDNVVWTGQLEPAGAVRDQVIHYDVSFPMETVSVFTVRAHRFAKGATFKINCPPELAFYCGMHLSINSTNFRLYDEKGDGHGKVTRVPVEGWIMPNNGMTIMWWPSASTKLAKATINPDEIRQNAAAQKHKEAGDARRTSTSE